MGHLLNIPADQLPHDPGQDKTPSRQEVKALLGDIAQYILREYRGRSNEEVVGRVRNLMYALRHAHYNVGMLAQILKNNGIEAPAWSSASMM